jgi:hypothetical protein
VLAAASNCLESAFAAADAATTSPLGFAIADLASHHE